MAYTYLIKCIPTDQVYYGVRTANTVPPHEDLWQKYFTSSKKVHALIDHYGADSFAFEIRQLFEDPQKAVDWEHKVLKRCKVLENDRWLNANIGGHILATPEIAAKISAFHKGVPKSEEHKQKIAHANKGKVKGPLSGETRAKISIAKSGSNNPMFGVPYSEERRQKQSASMRGRASPLKGRKFDDEKHKGGRKNKNRKHDPVIIAKRAATQRSLNMKRERKICERCGKDVAVNIYAQYHGDKCIPNTPKIYLNEGTKNHALALKSKGHKRERKNCPYCSKDVAVNIFARYHGDRCKFKPK